MLSLFLFRVVDVVVVLSKHLIIRPFRKSLKEYDPARKICLSFMKATEVLQ